MSGPRERLVDAAVVSLRRRGAFATSVSGLLSESGTARNSLYQHFGGGKSDLLVAATREAGGRMTRFLTRLTRDHAPVEAVAGLLAWWRNELVDNDFELGCPIAAAALAVPDEPAVAAVARGVFDDWRALLADAVVRDGASTDAAADYAEAAIDMIEGAIVRCRIECSTGPLDAAERNLRRLYPAAAR